LATDSERDWTECVAAVRRRDAAAAHALVEGLHPLVARIVAAHLPRRESADDLVQEVFLKLFTRLAQYRPRPGTPFEHWVSRVTVHTCLDRLRAERRRPELRWGDLTEATSDWLRYMAGASDIPPHTAPAAARETVTLLLRQLCPADRLVLSLLDLDERSVREVSQITGWSKTGVKVRAFRARARLRKLAGRWKCEVCDD